MKQVKTSMCTTMCCSMMNMSMYMHSMCKTQHSALKENSNKHRINKVINRKLLYQYEPVNIQNNNPFIYYKCSSVARQSR